ncbi:Stk1 family PASTA domain-containing Ser/Thr kinase [Xylanimonas allomyrinae]|uniref:non-specific serine/threonine protein kinase n=1 Tax=Xylanimonas allomyrinae TaxID=2509459 RepID=A0A4P6F0Z9_9MICO|nr:Stk1 family PASTA domain-containing Ser/Thr kinase [Xylanimonas allomyrinae]QAY64008.1 Stk1 family PASTA domain-containing Ser/Thr kinase [Xylanimonas allomyrinae]
MVDNTPRVLAGRYEVGELIGRGGMAEVHIGHDARLGRTVAIKVLRSDLARDPSFLARFRREAQAAAALNHPAIVAVYDTGEDVHSDPATGHQVHVPFIVMEYVEGHTVRDILQDGAAVPIEEAVEITAGVLGALEYSHHAGIVHRDIKPANVMITPTGAVKVMDFGIARAIADSAATMTQTHAVIGTAQYLSPEQARGEQVDARSDLYSTGCLLFELLTGRPPFVGDSPVAVAYQHVGQAPQRPSEIASDVPEVLDRITLKALAKERTARYSSAAEFRGDLEAAMRGGAVVAPAIGAGVAAAGVAGADPTVAFGAPGPGDAGTQLLTPEVAATQQWGAPVPETGVLPDGVGPAGSVGARSTDRAARKRKKALIWTLSVVGVLAVAAVVIALILGNRPSTPQDVAVPSIPIGSTREQARQIVQEADFRFRDAIDTDSNAEKDTSTRQEPAAGEMAAPNSFVTVYFSGGPSTVAVPDVTGKSQEEARSMIQAAGLVWGTVTPESSKDVEKDNVTRTEPPAREAATSGDTVNVFISDGTVNLTNLVGMTRDDAIAELTRLGLNSDTEDVESATATPGSVVSQDPQPGNVPQGQRVTLGLAVAPALEQVQVPQLTGLVWDDAAQAMCRPLNCVPELESSDTVPASSIIRTDPPAGTTLNEGDTVRVIVSTGQKVTGGGGGGGGGGNPGTSPSPNPGNG